MQKTIKIGIIDDNSFLINAIKEKLSFFDDLQIKFSAIHGEDLLQKLAENHNVDVLLMDIEMPVLNGIEATKAVKSKYPASLASHLDFLMVDLLERRGDQKELDDFVPHLISRYKNQLNDVQVDYYTTLLSK